jgi:hypothetical protein
VVSGYVAQDREPGATGRPGRRDPPARRQGRRRSPTGRRPRVELRANLTEVGRRAARGVPMDTAAGGGGSRLDCPRSGSFRDDFRVLVTGPPSGRTSPILRVTAHLPLAVFLPAEQPPPPLRHEHERLQEVIASRRIRIATLVGGDRRVYAFYPHYRIVPLLLQQAATEQPLAP